VRYARQLVAAAIVRHGGRLCVLCYRIFWGYCRTMNPRESLNQSCLITADHYDLCEEKSNHGANSIRRVTDTVVSKKQSTHNVKWRAERDKQ
jgi:hypothetical protein